jgi:hypothetical protein
MSHGYIGDSRESRAFNKIVQSIEKTNQKTELRTENLIEQLKRTCPHTWKDELEEIKRERQYPNYLAAKKAARANFLHQWNNTPRMLREEGLTAEKYVSRLMKKWIQSNCSKYPVK